MEPSEVRRRILEDHARLRRDVEQIESFAREVLDGLRIPLSSLKAEGEALIQRLSAHMRWEESHLLPVLREVDAWGAERAESLVRDHRDQRELLAFALARLHDSTRPADLVAGDVVQLAELLREDMRLEERDLLDARVLRDDIIGIEVETG